MINCETKRQLSLYYLQAIVGKSINRLSFMATLFSFVLFTSVWWRTSIYLWWAEIKRSLVVKISVSFIYLSRIVSFITKTSRLIALSKYKCIHIHLSGFSLKWKCGRNCTKKKKCAWAAVTGKSSNRLCSLMAYIASFSQPDSKKNFWWRMISIPSSGPRNDPYIAEEHRGALPAQKECLPKCPVAKAEGIILQCKWLFECVPCCLKSFYTATRAASP